MPREALKVRYQRLGTLYGYPQCCIDQFLIDVKALATGTRKEKTNEQVRTPAQIKVMSNRKGYVPCRCCAEKIVMGKVTQESLIVSRSKDLRPFPDERHATKIITTRR